MGESIVRRLLSTTKVQKNCYAIASSIAKHDSFNADEISQQVYLELLQAVDMVEKLDLGYTKQRICREMNYSKDYYNRLASVDCQSVGCSGDFFKLYTYLAINAHRRLLHGMKHDTIDDSVGGDNKDVLGVEYESILSRLDAPIQKIFRLTIAGYTLSRIAENMSISVGSVRYKKAQGRKELKRCIV